jgi:hypothetical protein
LGLLFAHPLIENRNLATYCVPQCLWDGHLAFDPVPEYGPVAGKPNRDPDFGKAYSRVLYQASRLNLDFFFIYFCLIPSECPLGITGKKLKNNMGISKNKMPHRPSFIFFLMGVLDFCCSCQVLNEFPKFPMCSLICS